MTKFFFDWTGEGPSDVDTEGLDFATADDAIAEGMLALGQVAKEAISRVTGFEQIKVTLTIRTSSTDVILATKVIVQSVRSGL